MNKTKEVKEPFCGACVAGLAAIAGAGTAGGSKAAKNKKTKKIIFWTGFSITIIAIIFLIISLFFRKCEKCR